MAPVTQIDGDDGADSLQGTSGPDLIYGFDPTGPTATLTSIPATRVATGLSQPVAAVAAPGDFAHLFIVERTGTIRILDLATGTTSLFLDLSASITTAGEGGVLGLAFDPNYSENGFFYVNVTNAADDTEIRRYQTSAADPLQADPASLLTLITVDQPAGLTNHKAGWLGFGADGLLYIPLGDGGGGGDPFDNAQNPQTLLGKILRLDVRNDAFPGDPTRNYAIPADNPFVGAAGILPEIWALGLRNPFRAGFDRATGDLYLGDVGQNAIEEIDLGIAGANYGWDVFEGLQGFEPGALGPGTLTDPIHTYGRSVGATVIGGYVHRGDGDALQGQYFFADFITGRVFTLRQQGGAWIATERTGQIAASAGAINNPSSFGEDAAGNLYVVDLDGDVFRLDLSVASADLGDTIDGAGGNDTLHAGAGDDRLRGGPGADVLVGGDGFDLADYATAAAAVIVNLAMPSANGGEAAGDTYRSIEGIVGSGFGDTISGGAAATRIDLGAGADTLRDTLADLAGDTVLGFARGDQLDIMGSLIGRSRLDVAATADGASLSAGGSTVALQGAFSGGDFMAVARGTGADAHTVFSFVDALPTLREGTSVAPASINGIANEPFLAGDGSVRFTLELRSAVAAHSNTLGAYRVAADGTISDVTVLFANTRGTVAGATVDLGVPADGQRIGFFLVQDGFDFFGALPNNLSFVVPGTATLADLDSGLPPALRSATLGQLNGATIFHSFSTLNPGDATQVLSGVSPGGRELVMGFEDLPGATGDNDFQDVVVALRVNNDGLLVV